jgi:hypothetical protein
MKRTDPMIKKQRLYAEIAARHTPEGVKVVTLAEGARASEAKAYGMAHRFPETEEAQDDPNWRPWIEVPRPTTFHQLWTYVHECVHMRSAISPIHEGNNYSSSEAEADLGALRILESEGLKPSLRFLKGVRRRIEYEARKDQRQSGAEYSSLAIECLAEFDRRITGLLS